MSAFVDVRLK